MVVGREWGLISLCAPGKELDGGGGGGCTSRWAEGQRPTETENIFQCLITR